MNRVALGLRGDDLLLEACQNPLSVGHGHTQIGDIVKTIRPVDRNDVDKRRFTVSPDLQQPLNPNHASTPDQDNRRENTALTLAPPNLRRSRRQCAK
jgi:hypothetical protein